jgi:ElaA protein
MLEGMRRTRALYPATRIRIGAQERLQAFYESLGFERASPSYLEDGIPHIEMLLPAGALHR